MQDLEGRVAVVTGGASGIGRGMAEAFLAAGMKVVVADVEAAALDTAVPELKKQGEVAGVVCDVSKPESVEALAQESLDHFGAVHVLCNNAGVAGSAGLPMWELPLDEWEWVLGVNLMGIVHGIRSFVPIMISQGQGGHVVNTSSMAGLMPSGGVYGVSKHAAVAISESLFGQLATVSPRIGVSVLCPGWVNTNILNSDRNRPETPRPAPGPEAPQVEALRQTVAGLIEKGLDPREVGDVVVKAIRDGRFYVLTHPWQKLVERRMQNILEDKDPVGMPPPMDG